MAHALDERRLGHGERIRPPPASATSTRALSGRAEQAAERLRQFAQLGQRLLIVGLANADLDAVAADRRTGVADARFAQRASHVVAQRLDLLLAHLIGVDLEEEVRAALQVEAEHDVALRPARPLATTSSGKKFGTANRQTITP